jgi:hypothetical protein
MPYRDWWENWNLSYLDDVFGPLYGGHSVQEAFYRTLEKWLPTYIAEFNRVLGSKVLVKPFEYRHRPDYRTLPRNAQAAILVEVPRTNGLPEVFQDSTRVNWQVDVMVFIYGTKDWQETQALTQAYAACVRACIIQNRSLEGFAETVMWDGEEYLEGEHSSGRTTGVSHVRFSVTVGNAMNMYGGLPFPDYAAENVNTEPSTAEPAPIPQATEANVELQKEQL